MLRQRGAGHPERGDARARGRPTVQDRTAGPGPPGGTRPAQTHAHAARAAHRPRPRPSARSGRLCAPYSLRTCLRRAARCCKSLDRQDLLLVFAELTYSATLHFCTLGMLFILALRGGPQLHCAQHCRAALARCSAHRTHSPPIPPTLHTMPPCPRPQPFAAHPRSAPRARTAAPPAAPAAARTARPGGRAPPARRPAAPPASPPAHSRGHWAAARARTWPAGCRARPARTSEVKQQVLIEGAARGRAPHGEAPQPRAAFALPAGLPPARSDPGNRGNSCVPAARALAGCSNTRS